MIDRLFKPVDGASLAFFRIWYGIIMFVECYRYLSKGWIERYYINPSFHFTYWGFDWITPWPGEWMYTHFYVMGLLSICVALGLFYRVSASLLFLSFTYVFLLEKANYLNHFYLISLIAFLMIFVPAHRTWSIDAWRTPKDKRKSTPTWALWLMRFQMGVPYFFGGIAKLNPDWLRGVPLGRWLQNRADMPLVGTFFQQEWCGLFMSYSGLLLDLLIVPLLLYRPTRLFAFCCGAAFHLMNHSIFSIGVFPWFMMGATTLFFDPDWPRFGRKEESTNWPQLPQKRALVTCSLILWVTWQSLFPLRHHLYPSYVSWSEEGHNYSWHMKLRSKSGKILFWVEDPPSNTKWQVRPRFLSARQERKMKTRPDLILQMAHHLRDEWVAKGYPNVEVYVESTARLNDHDKQVLIDPLTNLAEQPRNIWPASWITEFKGEAR